MTETKYGMTYAKLPDGRTVVYANPAKNTPQITIGKGPPKNTDYIIRFLGEVSALMPNTKAGLAAAYARGLTGEINSSDSLRYVGETFAPVSGGLGVQHINDRQNAADFVITLNTKTIRNIAQKSFGPALRGRIEGFGLTSAEIASLRARDPILDALSYVLGHEIGGHIYRAGESGPRHNRPCYSTDTQDIPYLAGYQDAFAAGIPLYTPLRDTTGIFYSYMGEAGTVPFETYASSQGRRHVVDGNNMVGGTGSKLTSLAILPTDADFSRDPTIASAELGQIIGSSLGRYIGGGLVGSLVSAPLLGALGQNIAQFLSSGGIGGNVATARGAFDKSFGDFSNDLKLQLQGAAVGTVSSLLSLELGNSLGISGFTSELISTGASSVFGQVLNNSIAIASTPTGQVAPSLFSGLDGKGLFGSTSASGVTSAGLFTSAFAGFFGSKLGSLILAPSSTQGAVLSSLGASVGAWAFGAGAGSAGAIGGIGTAISAAFQGIGNFAAPLIGSLVGFVLGSLIGRLFGSKKPRVPTASAETVMGAIAGEWSLGSTTSANGGNQTLVRNAASIASTSLNSILSVLVGDSGRVIAQQSLTERIGHTGALIWVDRISGGATTRIYSGSAADVAVEAATLDGARSALISGGEIFSKRAVYRSQQATLVQLTGDLEVARDFTVYGQNLRRINSLLLQSPNSEFSLAWAITLQRAAELRLTDFAESDFYGGLAGFANSFGAAVGGAASSGYEGLDIRWEGGPVRLGSRGERVQHVTSETADRPAQIFRLYDMALGRAPLAWEIGEWLYIMDQGHDIYSAGALMLGDPGVNATFGSLSDDNFIREMYQRSLHRQPSQWEIDVWRPNIQSGGPGRGWVLAWFSEYAEHRNFTDPTIAAGITYSEYIGKDLFSILPTASADGRSVQIPDLAQIGYRATDPSNLWDSTNDFVDWRYGGGTGMDGQGGDDILIGSEQTDNIFGSAGYDWLDGRGGHDALYGGDGDDVVIGGSGVDAVVGGNGNDYLSGGDDNDYVQGWINGPAPGGLYGEGGNDTLVGGGGVDSLFGQDGDDKLIIDQDGGGTWDYLDGGSGTDLVSFERFTSGVYADMWTGQGGGYTTQTYSDGWVSIEGMIGTDFDDTLYGQDGDNIIKGGAGNDTIAGRPGDDTIEGGAGADYINGDAGTNTASYEGSSEGVIVDLSTGTALGGDASGDVFYNIQNLKGSKYADELTGDAGNNVIEGLAGDDVVVGTGGYDSVSGGSGFDIFDASAATSGLTVQSSSYAYINGGTSYLSSIEGFVGTAFGDNMSGTAADEFFDGAGGNDTLTGGDGSDTYRFGLGYGYDTIVETRDGANAIQIASGLDFADLAFIGVGTPSNLMLQIRSSGESVFIGDNWWYENDGNHRHKIKSISFEGGSTVDIDAIDWAPIGAASDAGTTIQGANNKADLIFAYAGADYISTGSYEIRGNVVFAGQGDDSIGSTAGDDQFLFERGDGADYLSDTGGADTIVMGPSVAADDVIYEIVDLGNGYSDLYIGIRDLNNPNLAASQVADRIRVAGGGTVMEDLDTGSRTLNTIEYVRVAGQEIDLTKSGLQFTTSYYNSYNGGGGGGYIPPVAIDLDGDGIELRSVEGSRIVTTDNDGALFRAGWVGPDDGLLALDRNGDGLIDRTAEISFTGDKEGAKTDLEGLAAYDTNEDGRLDEKDARFGDFRVFQDKNQDGIGVKGELLTLKEAGITSISLKGQATGFTYSDGIDNTVLATAEIGWADAARVGKAYDIALAVRQVRTDGGDKERAEKIAQTENRKGSDALDPLLMGYQALTVSQVSAVKDKLAKATRGVTDTAGLLGRVEGMLEGSTITEDGLLKADLSKVKRLPGIEKVGVKADAYASSEWTKAGSQESGKPDDRTVDFDFSPRTLTAEEEKAIADATSWFDRQRAADEAKAVARREAEIAEAKDAPTDIPSDEELARRAKTDSFRLLQSAQTADGEIGHEEVAGSAQQSSEATTAVAAPSDVAPSTLGSVDAQSDQVEDDPQPTATVAAKYDSDTDGVAPDSNQAPPLQPTTQEPNLADDQYDVVIRAANARLVQALASFGDAPTMMASYQGLNVANDAGAAWISVDALPSVRQMASVA